MKVDKKEVQLSSEKRQILFIETVTVMDGKKNHNWAVSGYKTLKIL
jgi:hypothetical protein